MKRLSFVLALVLACATAEAREGSLEDLAAQLSSSLSQAGPFKVAVLALPHHDNRISDGPLLVSEQLTTLLSKQKNISVIERNHITKLFDENGLSETGQFDPDEAKLMGEILGADILVVGTLINLNHNKTEVNVRGVRASTGQVVAAARAVIDRTWEDRPVLSW